MTADALSPWQASRLAERAAGPPGWFARRAWRSLLAAGDAGDREAIHAVWLQWLRTPREDAWVALVRWRPAEVTHDLCELAVSSTVPAATRERMAAFCVERGLAPDDPVERVVFHLLTGQFAHVHDEDPDGVLVAEGYQAAAPTVRAALRGALTADGDLDLLRILTATNRATGLGDDDAEHLVGHFAAIGDWDRLWRLTTQLPVRAAVATVRRFDDWRPADAAGRDLFTLLARTDPDLIEEAVRELRATSTRIAIASDLHAAAFAPDGGSVVLAAGDGTRRAGKVRRFALPGGKRLARWSVGLREGSLLDLGDVVVLEELSSGYRLGVLRGDGGGLRALHDARTSGPAINSLDRQSVLAAGDGFVTTVDGSELLIAGGRPLTVRRIPALRLPPPRWSLCRPVAAHPGSGRLAVYGRASLAVLAPNRQPVAWTDDTRRIHGAAFLAADRLVTADENGLTRWQVSGRRLIPAATGPRLGLLTHVTALPDRGQILLVGRPAPRARTRLMLLDAETLDPAGELPALFDRPAWCVWASPDGGRIVFADRDGPAHVHDIVSESVLDALTRPAVSLGPVDADRLAEARRRAGTDAGVGTATGTATAAWRRGYGPAVHEAFDVLGAVLRYRLET